MTVICLELKAIICVAGGLLPGNVKEDFFATLDKMWKLNVQSSVAAAYIASQLLVPAGYLLKAKIQYLVLLDYLFSLVRTLYLLQQQAR